VPPASELPHAVIDPSALTAAKAYTFIQLMVPLPPLKPTAQSWRGVLPILEAQVLPPVAAIPRFIQLVLPLPPLNPMAQSRRGVVQVMEVQVHPLVAAMSRFVE
jgi:hypothetical protein